MLRKLVCAAACLALAAVTASAGGGFGIFGSWWDTEDADAGTGGGVRLKAPLGDTLALDARVTYLTDFDDEDPASEDLVVIPLELGLVFEAPVAETLSLYAGGGVGYYVMPEYEIKEPIGGSEEPDFDPDDTFGFFAVAGLELGLSESVALFGEAKYTWLEVDEGELDGDTIDDLEVSLEGVGINLGLLFRW